ncbi:MAG: dynamin family protein [Candidatus Hydrogenedentes bacterium]|nr:dynamin family protein [Candidatus Hydrogenedentota bacterium]
MSIEKHTERRAWAFQALDELQNFVQDSDFEGSLEEEDAGIERKRIELRDGKYRVVFLGAFNVGKSTMINALLGDEYLPTVLEECTTKITHVLRGDTMRAVVRLHTPCLVQEVDGLRNLLEAFGIGAAVSCNEQNDEIALDYAECNPRALLNTLRALVTMNASEDFPQLESLRRRFDELVVYLPNETIAEDIALVDSPGAHTISDTNKRIAQEIIPNCHLVICLLDSQSAGNEQNRAFIESIIKHKHRKVFFVLNKSDQLNPHEIDPMGRRGPAKDLMRSLDGIVQNPEIFFVSSLYALIATHLQEQHVSLEDVDKNAKVKIPFQVHQGFMETDDPAKAAAGYLMERSNFGPLRDRLMNYLYTENREGAIVESICTFIDATAYRYARPLETKLELTRNVPRLDDLRRQREQLSLTLQRYKAQGQRVTDEFDAMSNGGNLDGSQFPGYQGLVENYVSKAAIEEEILKPLRAWLDAGDNLKTAKREDFQPLTKELESKIDAFISALQVKIDRYVEEVEGRSRARASQIVADTSTILGRGSVEASRASLVAVDAGMGKSYAAFGFVGLLLGAAAGAGLGYASLQSPPIVELISTNLPSFPQTVEAFTAVGAAKGAVLGLILGLIARTFGSNEARKAKLNQRIGDRVEQVLQKATKEQILQALDSRRGTFRLALQGAFDKAFSGLNNQINAILAEEAKIKKEQEEIIARLEPKIEALHGLGDTAREYVSEGLATKSAEVA